MTIEPQEDHTHTLIFLHGLGDDGDNYKEMFS